MKSRKIVYETFAGLLSLMLFACVSAPSSSSVAGKDLDAAIKEAAVQMETNIPSGTLVALVSVASPSTVFSTQVLTRLESAIVSSRKLVVVDRANLDKVRAEQGFQLSGEVDDESAKSIGKLLGAGAIVTGSLADLGDVYSLTLKAINIETATVAVSYLADLSKSKRVETLLASGDGADEAMPSAYKSPSAGSSNVAAGGTPSISKPAAAQRFTVTFIAAGANGTIPTAQTVQGGESITIPDAGAMTKARAHFGGWNTKADGTGTPHAAGDAFKVKMDTRLYAQWIETVYKIGETGPAGGLVCYDKGNDSDGWRYLEAAPANTEKTAVFFKHGNFGQWMVARLDGNNPLLYGMTNKGYNEILSKPEIGFGKPSSEYVLQSIITAAEWDTAIQVCHELVLNGFDDWFLPSLNELSQMYGNLARKGLGGFAREPYWSSTAYSDSFSLGRACYVNFNDGDNQNMMEMAKTARVRAMRQF